MTAQVTMDRYITIAIDLVENRSSAERSMEMEQQFGFESKRLVVTYGVGVYEVWWHL